VIRGNAHVNAAPKLALRRVLHCRGLRYRDDQPLRVDAGRAIGPDLVFFRRRVAVFIKGGCWPAWVEHRIQPTHNSTYWRQNIACNVARDRREERHLALAGWTVLRIWEHEPADESAEQVVSVLEP